MSSGEAMKRTSPFMKAKMTYTTESDIEAMAEDAFVEWNPHPPMHSLMLNMVRVNQKKPFIAGYIAAASPVHAELARLKQRLQMDWIYNHRGEPEPWTDGMPDAIDTLEQMVESIQRDNERLRAELARAKAENERLREALYDIQMNNMPYRARDAGNYAYNRAKQALQQKGGEDGQ